MTDALIPNDEQPKIDYARLGRYAPRKQDEERIRFLETDNDREQNRRILKECGIPDSEKAKKWEDVKQDLFEGENNSSNLRTVILSAEAGDVKEYIDVYEVWWANRKAHMYQNLGEDLYINVLEVLRKKWEDEKE